MDRHPTMELVCAVLLSSCSGSGSVALGGLRIDEVPIVAGVEDESRDLAVLGVRVQGNLVCAGTLVAADVLLTARHCLDATAAVSCGGTAPSSSPAPGLAAVTGIEVVQGETLASAIFAASGRAVVSPSGADLCAADIALLLLDRPVPALAPLEVSRAVVSSGERVRTVAFGGGTSGGPFSKILREHVPVVGQTATELAVRESSCGVAPGGPALDETTGAVIGVFSRLGSVCDGPEADDVFIRTDAFVGLVETALAERLGGQAQPGIGVDAGAHAVKLATDYGQSCTAASQCAAGVCVDDGQARYCSRSCDGQDKCPTSFGCEGASGSFACAMHSP